MPYKGMFPYVPGLAKELKLSRVIEIVDEVWFLEVISRLISSENHRLATVSFSEMKIWSCWLIAEHIRSTERPS